MSRPSVFRRIASWLKNTAKLNEERREKEAQQRVRRTYSVQTLEDREMLHGAFVFDDVEWMALSFSMASCEARGD